MNDRLFELEIRKIIQEYKLLDIEEEWKNELINSNKETFMKDISQVRIDTNKPEPEVVIPSDNLNDNLDVENDVDMKKNHMSDNVKKLFREIVKLTHPDKTMKKNNRDELNDLYIRAKIATDESNIYDLLVICDRLDIKWSIDISEKKMLEDNLEVKKNKIKSIESSYIWLWIKAESIEEKWKIVNLFIEKNS